VYVRDEVNQVFAQLKMLEMFLKNADYSVDFVGQN